MRAFAIKALGASVAALVAVAPAMSATVIDTKAVAALTAMKSLNVITLGDYQNTGNGDIEGKLWVGGNSSGSKMQVGFGNSNQKSGQSAYATMTVGGNFTNNGVDLYNGNTANGTVGTYNSSSTGSYGLKVGGNMTDTGNGFDIKTNGANVTVGGYVGRLSIDGSNANVMINGSLSNFAENGANAIVKANTYGDQNVNGIGSGSNVYINGSNPSQNSPPSGWHFNAGQTLNAPTTSAMASDVSAMSVNMKDLSTQLDSLSNTNSFSKISAGGNSSIYDLLFNVTNTSNGYAVFDIQAADLFGSNARGIGFTLNGGSFNGSTIPIIINVLGMGSGNYNLGLSSGVNGYTTWYDSSLSSNIIWNLVGSTGTFTTSNQIEGSVLDANGTVDTSNGRNIEGSVVASIFKQGGEVHLGTFNAGDTSSNAITALSTTAAVPEAHVWVMMIIGFGLIGGIVRKQKQAGVLLRI